MHIRGRVSRFVWRQYRVTWPILQPPPHRMCPRRQALCGRLRQAPDRTNGAAVAYSFDDWCTVNWPTTVLHSLGGSPSISGAAIDVTRDEH